MAAIKIRVVLENQDDLVVGVPPGKDVVCALKRQIGEKLGVSPVEQRLSLSQDSDNFELHTVYCQTRNRTANVDLMVKGKNSDAYQVKVDRGDSVLDLKFLLAEQTNVATEIIRLWVEGTPLHNSDLLQNCGAFNPDRLVIIQFVYPPEKPGHGEVHRTSPQGVLKLEGRARNLCDNFRQNARNFADHKFLGARAFNPDGTRGQYEWITYRQGEARVNNIAAGLYSLGLRKGDAIGIMSINRPEWQLADTACFTQAFVSVPLYDTLGPDAARYILNHAEVQAVVVSKEKLDQVVDCKQDCPNLRYIIVMDDFPSDREFVAQQVQNGTATFNHSISSLEELGSKNLVLDAHIDGSDLSTVCYTSGTTGTPKGVICTHDTLCIATSGIGTRTQEETEDGTEVLISYLPLAHIYGRIMELNCIAHGNAIGYFQGDPLKLVEDVQALKPSVFPGVPRVWQKVYDSIMAGVSQSNFIRKWIFKKAFQTQLELIKARKPRSEFWDRIVFSKVAANFGGNVKLISSGAAPLAAQIPHFLSICLNTEYAEGYGLSESCAIGTTTVLDDTYFGHVGTPPPTCDVKLVSVPDMDYLVTDQPEPRGEIWLRGPAMFKGYFKEPGKTSDAFEDGWFKTGDVGKWRSDGNLQIIDRKKNIFKLSQGEYIRPEHIENVYKMNKYVGNVFVYGDSLRNYLVAIIVPDFDVLQAGGAPIDSTQSPAEICASEDLKNFLKKELRATGEKEGLTGFEHCKNIALSPEDFTVESGLLTPSMKLKRHQAKQFFQNQIDGMYATTTMSKL